MRSPFHIVLLSAAGLLLSFSTTGIISVARAADDTSDVSGVHAGFSKTGRGGKTGIFALNELDVVLRETEKATIVLGNTAGGNTVEAFYFKGISNLNALVIAGVHGSELSSIEVASRLIDSLAAGARPYYNVIVIPSLFPDNADEAMHHPSEMGSPLNIGRYSWKGAVDPNRQMPTPGKPFDLDKRTDHMGRTIERENQFMLELIQRFRPVRIASVHAIRNTNYGGIYADPRTTHQGIALGYSTDSTLAVTMAAAAKLKGSNVEGNRLAIRPNALYYKDPTPVAAGQPQKRNMTGAGAKVQRGSGVSMGTWGTTAIREADSTLNRPAMRVITMEFPGAKRPADYKLGRDKEKCSRQVDGFVAAIKDIFLSDFVDEESDATFEK